MSVDNEHYIPNQILSIFVGFLIHSNLPTGMNLRMNSLSYLVSGPLMGNCPGCNPPSNDDRLAPPPFVTLDRTKLWKMIETG